MPTSVLAAGAPIAALIAALALFVAPGPAAADAFLARNGVWVHSTGTPGVMEVVERPGPMAGPQYFCAAGEYARGPLRARATDRVVLVAPATRSPQFNGRRTALIQLVPRGTPLPRDEGLIDSLTLSAHDVGEHVSVAHAQFLCNHDRRVRRF